MSTQQLSNPSPYSDEGPDCADNGDQDNTAFTTNSDAAAANTITTNAPPNGGTTNGGVGEDETGDRRHSLSHLSSPSIGPSPASSATRPPAPATANWTASAFNSNTSTTAAPAPAAAQRTQSGPGRNRSLPPPSYALSVKSPLSVSTEPDDLPSMSKNDVCNLLGACESLTRSGGRQHSVESSIVLSPSGFAQPPPPQHQLSSSGNTPNNVTSVVPSPPHAAQAGATGGAPAPPSYEVTLLSRSASGTFHQPTPALTSMSNSVQNTPPIASSGIVSPPPGLSGNNVLGGSLNSGSGPPPVAGPPALPPPSYAQYQRLSVHQSNSQSNSGSGTNLQQATRVTSQDSSATGTPKHTSSRFQSISGPTGMTLPPARQSLSPDNQYPSPVTSPPPASAPIPNDSSTHNPPLFTMVNTSQNRPRSMSNDAAAGAYVNTSLGSPTLDPSAPNTGLRSPHHSSSQPGGGGGTANNTSISVRVGGGATPTTTPSGSFRIPPNHEVRPAVVQGSVSNSSFSGRQESHSSVSIKVGGIMLPPTPTRAGSGAGLPSSTFNILSQRDREEGEELESFDDEEHGHIGRRHADLPPPMSGSAPTQHHRQRSLSNNNSFAGGGGGNSFGGKPPVAGTPLSQYQPQPQQPSQSQQQQQHQQRSSMHGPPPPSAAAPPAVAVLNHSNNGSFSSGPINQQWRGGGGDGGGQQQQQPQYPQHQPQQGGGSSQQPPMPGQHSSSSHFPPVSADSNNYGQHQRGGGGGGGQPPFNNSFGRPSLPPQAPLVGVPVPQLSVSLSTTQMDPPRADGGGGGAMMAPTTTSSMIQRQCASLRVTRLPEEEGARIRYIDTDHMPPNPNNVTPAVDSNTLIGFLTNKELVDTYTSVSDFIASSTVPVKANFNEYPTETQHQRIDRILHQPILTSSSRPNSPSAPPSPVPVAVDGHYLLTKVRAMMLDHDPCWMLIHPCPPLLLHMLKAEIRTLRQRGIEPVVVFDGLSFSADVQESLVDCRDSLRAASTVWSQLHSRTNNPAASRTATVDAVAPTPTSPGAAPSTPTATASSNAEENRKLLKVVRESTWVSEEAQDITGIVFRYLVSELRVNAMFAPYSSWAQLGLMFSEGAVVAVMGPPELLAIEAPSLKVIASVTSKDIRVLDKSKILDGLFGTSSIPGPIHEFCDRYNTEIILPFQQHHQRQQQEVHIREQREHSLGGSMGGASSHPPSPFFSAVTAATSNGTTGSIRSTPLPPPPPVSSYPDINRAPSPGPDGLFPFGVPPSITPMTPIRVASNLFQMLVLCKSPHPRLRYLRPSFLPPHYSGGWECLYRELSMNRALPNTTRRDIPPPPLYNSFLDLLRDREIPVEIRDIVKRKFEAREFPSGTLPADAERAELDEQLVRGVHCAKLGLLFLTKTPGYSTLATEHRSQLFGYVQALIDDVSHNSDTGAWRGAASGVGAGGGGSAAEWCQQRGALMLVAPTASLAMQNAMNRHHRPLIHCCEVERVELLETGGKAVDPALGIDCMGPHSCIPLDCAPYRLPSGQVHHTQLVLGSVPAGLPKVLKQRLPAIANYLLSVGLINPALLDTAASKHPMITTHTPLSDTLELRDKMKMMLLIQGQVVGFLAGVFGTTLTKSPEWVRWFIGGRGSGGTDGQAGAGGDAESTSLKETLFDTQGSLSDVIPTLRHWSLHDLLPTRASGTRVVARQGPSDPLCIVHADLALPHETSPVTFEDALLVVIAKGHAIRFVELTSLSVGVSSTSPNPAGTRGQHTNYQQQPVASTTITEEYGWEVYAPCLGTVPPPILSSSPSTETITEGTTTYIRAAPAASPTMTRPHSHAETNAQHLEHNGIAQITASSMLMSLEFLGYIDVNPRDCCKFRDQSSSAKRGSGHHITPVIRTGNASRFTRVFDGLRAGALRPLDVVRVLLAHDIVPIQFSPDAAITGLSDLGCTLLRAIRTAPIHLLPPVLRVPHTASATSSPQPTPLGASNSALPDDTQHIRQTYSHLFAPIADSDQGLLVTLIELLRTGFLDDQPFNFTHYIVTEYKEDSSSSQSPTWDSSTEPGRLEGRHIDSGRDATWFESSDMHGGLEDAAVALLSRIACLVPVQMHPTASWDANYDRRLTTFAQMAGVVQQTLRGLSEVMAVRAVVGNTTLVTPTPGSGPSSSATSRADKPLSPAYGVELSECAGLPFALPFAEVPSPIGGLLLKDFLTAVPPCQQLNRLVSAIAEHPRPAHPLTTQEEQELTQRLAGASSSATPPTVGAEVTVSTAKATSSSAASKAAASSPSLTINTNASFNNQCSVSSSQPSLISIASGGGTLHMESHDGRTRSPLAINAVNLASGWLAAEHQVSWVEQKYEGILNVREELTRILSFTRVALWIILELNGGAAGSDSTSSSNKKSSSLRKTVIRARELLDHQEGLWASLKKAALDASLSPSGSPPQQSLNQHQSSDNNNNNQQQHQQPPPRPYRHNPYQQYAQPTSPLGGEGGGGGGRGGGPGQQQRPRRGRGGGNAQ